MDQEYLPSMARVFALTHESYRPGALSLKPWWAPRAASQASVRIKQDGKPSTAYVAIFCQNEERGRLDSSLPHFQIRFKMKRLSHQFPLDKSRQSS